MTPKRESPIASAHNTLAGSILDGARACGAALVVFGHGLSFFYPELGFSPPNAPYVQNFAVVLFFIVSGYLVAQQLARYQSDGKTFLEFFFNRFARIYSGLVPSLIFIALLDGCAIAAGLPYDYSAAYNVKTFVGNLLMLQDYPIRLPYLPSVTSFGTGRPLWTLAIEWWIYLFVGWATLNAALLVERRKLWAWGLLAVFAIVPLLNLVTGRGGALFSYWLAGALAYVLISNSQIKPNMRMPLAVAFGIAIAAACVRLASVGWDCYDRIFALVLAIAFGLLMAFARTFDDVRGIGHRWIRGLADVSFTLYLIHYSVQSHLVSAVSIGVIPIGIAFICSLTLPFGIAAAIAPFTEMRYRVLARYLVATFASRKSLSPG